jgi:hypothetical protein
LGEGRVRVLDGVENSDRVRSATRQPWFDLICE